MFALLINRFWRVDVERDNNDEELAEIANVLYVCVCRISFSSTQSIFKNSFSLAIDDEWFRSLDNVRLHRSSLVRFFRENLFSLAMCQKDRVDFGVCSLFSCRFVTKQLNINSIRKRILLNNFNKFYFLMPSM